MEPDDLLCSQNAHDKTVLVPCAQWKINQPPSLEIKRASLEGAYISLDARSEGQSGDSLGGRQEDNGSWVKVCSTGVTDPNDDQSWLRPAREDLTASMNRLKMCRVYSGSS